MSGMQCKGQPLIHTNRRSYTTWYIHSNIDRKGRGPYSLCLRNQEFASEQETKIQKLRLFPPSPLNQRPISSRGLQLAQALSALKGGHHCVEDMFHPLRVIQTLVSTGAVLCMCYMMGIPIAHVPCEVILLHVCEVTIVQYIPVKTPFYTTPVCCTGPLWLCLLPDQPVHIPTWGLRSRR